MDAAVETFRVLLRSTRQPRLDVAMGLIGAAFDRACDPAGVVSQLDGVARTTPPDVQGLLTRLFAASGLRGDDSHYHALDNSLLHRVLARQLGMPITLSIVAIEVGRRVGVPVEGVGLPGHFVVRCGEQYADPFAGPDLYRRDEMLARWRRRTGAADEPPAYLWRPATNRQILIRVLNNIRATVAGDPLLLAIAGGLRAGFDELDEENRRAWARALN